MNTEEKSRKAVSVKGYVGLSLNVLGMLALIGVIKYIGEHPATHVWLLYFIPFGCMVLGIGFSFNDMKEQSDTYVQSTNFFGPL